MIWKTVAVIEPHTARYKALSAGLKKAGLRVSNTRDVDQLQTEQLVVVGSSVKNPSRVARDVRRKLPARLRDGRAVEGLHGGVGRRGAAVACLAQRPEGAPGRAGVELSHGPAGATARATASST